MSDDTDAAGRRELALGLAQHAIWLDSRLSVSRTGRDDRYRLGTMATIGFPLDPPTVSRALRLLAGRHDGLRLRVSADEPRQWLASPSEPPFRVTDLSGAAEPHAALADALRRIAAEPFEFGDAPLYRVELIRLGPADWRLVITCHHVLADTLSLLLAQRYWLDIHDELCGNGGTARRSSMVAAIAADTAYAEGPGLAEDVAHFARRLANPPPLLFARRPPPDESARDPSPVRLELAASNALTAALLASGLSRERALFALAALALGRRTQRDEAIIGLAVHGREAESRLTLGMFATALAIRVAFRADETIAAAVARIAAVVERDLRHRRAPPDAVARALGPGAAERGPLYDVAVSILPLSSILPTGDELAGRPVRIETLRPRSSPATLSIFIEDFADGSLDIEAVCDPTRLSGAECRRFLDRLKAVLDAFAAAPETPLARIDALTGPERQLIAAAGRGSPEHDDKKWEPVFVEKSCESKKSEREDDSIKRHLALIATPKESPIDLFAAVASATPDAIAIITETMDLTYRSLDAAAGQLADRLRTAGAARGDVVGVATGLAPASVVAFLALLKAGCAYLPLDPALPAARRAAILADAGARFTIDAGPDATTPAVEPRAASFDRPRHADDIAYVIYTSGSSGRPKGVAVPPSALVALFAARQAYDPIGPGDRVLASVPTGFDVSVLQLLLPLLGGASVVILDAVATLSPRAFWSFVRRHKITSFNSLPAVMQVMLEDAAAAPSLKRLLLGGEPLPAALARRLRTALPGCALFNVYGLTEATIESAVHRLEDRDLDGPAPIPAGRPIAGTHVHILGPGGGEVGLGTTGELFIGGAGLAAFYLGDVALTEEKFIHHAEFGRLLKSGDLAHWTETGEIVLDGRADALIKIRGVRVDPAEIEAALAGLAGVAAAAVTASTRADAGAALAAWIVADDPAAPPSVAALRAGLAEILPPVMIPTIFARLDRLPLTTNGKIDRAALASKAWPEPAGDKASGATAIEQGLVEIFAELAGVTGLTVADDFFISGGHSLIAIQLVARIRQRFAVELPVRAIFEQRRFDAIARAIAEERTPAEVVPPIVAGRRAGRIPLSFAQERLWFLDRFAPASPAYTITNAFRLTGPLDVAALNHALAAALKRHESLRTAIRDTNGEAEQIVAADASIMLCPERVTEAALAGIAATEAATPFDLARPPLLRARLLRLADEHHVALVSVHHIVADGWSAGLLLRDLAVLYNAALKKNPDPLPRLALHYADYAIWQRQWLDDRAMAPHLAFWRQHLDGAPPHSTLPTDFPRPAVQSFRGASLGFHLPADLSSRLKEKAGRDGTTPFILLLTALAAVLARWTGEDDIVIGTPVANRRDPAVEGIIGFFVNTLALRAKISDETSLDALAGGLRDSVLDAFAHEDVPFERLVEALKPPRDLARHPIFQVLFTFDAGLVAPPAFDGLIVEPLPVAEATARFDLALTLCDDAAGIGGTISYASDLFAPETVARFARHFECMVRALVTAAGTEVAAVDLLDEDDRAHVVGDWSGQPAPWPDETVPGLFNRAALRQPQAIAVVHGRRTIRFGALNRRVGRLARGLVAAGARAGEPIGVLLPRGIETIVAPLAILTAGAVYLPLDPALPDARLAEMLADAGSRLVLTTARLGRRLPAGLRAMSLAELAAADDGAATPDVAPEAACYIIYTSGSTGQPKGVVVPHRALAHLARARLAHDPLGPGDRVLAAMPVGFDVSLGQIVTPLFSGATVVVADPLQEIDGAAFWRLMRDQAITHLNSGHSYLDAVIDAAGDGLALRRLMLGGEPLTSTLANRIRRRLPGVELINIYGPTEACIDATAHVVTGNETDTTFPIGRPLAGMRVFILDSRLCPVAPGLCGEIFLGGPQLALFYLGRAELTHHHFIDHADFGRLYRTGDLARWLNDGTIDFLGRADRQVKFRGFRIEPGEIEARLSAHPDLAGAAVIVRAIAGVPHLIAYARPRDGRVAPAAGQLKRWLAERLPSYMVPSDIVAVADIPFTPNAKLDIDRLPDPLMARQMIAREPPQTPTESRLHALWSELLGARDIGIDDNFFDLGGHSLLVLRLLAAIDRDFGQKPTVGDLFRCQSIRTLAGALDAGPGLVAKSGNAVVPIAINGKGSRPLHLIHAIDGSVLCYRALATRLGGDFAIRGLESGEEALRHASLARLAADHVAALKAHQNEGPYRLLGYSFGGQLAFAMAALLCAGGDAVASLTLLDTSPPDAEAQATITDAALPPLVRHFIKLADDHRPKPIDVPLSYVIADRRQRGDDGPARAAYWQGLAGKGGRCASLAADHFEMLGRAHAGALADLIRPWL